MRGGRLRHRITIQNRTRSQDSTTGAITSTWSDLHANVPAEVLTGAGKEGVTSGLLQDELMARINIRWFDISRFDILACRIIWDGTTYSIESAETDVTDRREWRLICKAGVSDGS